VSSERGQASVELVACAFVLVLVAVAGLTALSAVRARIEAERVADQAAVLIAERRPLPARLRDGADIRREGAHVIVSVPLAVAVPGLPAEQTAVATVPG
jgi:hypothetical protein